MSPEILSRFKGIHPKRQSKSLTRSATTERSLKLQLILFSSPQLPERLYGPNNLPFSRWRSFFYGVRRRGTLADAWIWPFRPYIHIKNVSSVPSILYSAEVKKGWIYTSSTCLHGLRKQLPYTVMRRITTFRLTTDRIYDGGPIRL